MKTLPRLALLALCCLPIACAATSGAQRVPFPSQDVPLTNAALTRIYFVREEHAGLNRKVVRVIDGQMEIGTLSGGNYLCWERPGGRSIGRLFYDAIDPSRGKLEGIADLDCEAGHVYYFNVWVGKEDGRPVIGALDAEEGRKLVADRDAKQSD